MVIFLFLFCQAEDGIRDAQESRELGDVYKRQPSLRQCPNRYAIRAGRNLPDKEFRYLRTVIVTAAVYWGFGQKLRLAANPLP